MAALPLSEGGEEAQLKRIAQLEAENDAVGQQLEKQLEAAGDESFHLVTFHRIFNFLQFYMILLI